MTAFTSACCWRPTGKVTGPSVAIMNVTPSFEDSSAICVALSVSIFSAVSMIWNVVFGGIGVVPFS